MTKYTTTSAHYLARLQAYKDSGDTAANKPGDRIWIAEMYGYAFGAANLDIWHQWAQDFMLYPSYTPARECGKGTWLHTRGGGWDSCAPEVAAGTAAHQRWRLGRIHCRCGTSTR